jgi:hypothetical protein
MSNQEDSEGKLVNILITPSERADQRTKNRLQEHGPLYEQRQVGTPSCMEGYPSVLVKHKAGWGGFASTLVEVQDACSDGSPGCLNPSTSPHTCPYSDSLVCSHTNNQLENEVADESKRSNQIR